MPGANLNDEGKRIPGVTTGQNSIVISLGAYAVGDSLGGLIEFVVHSPGGKAKIKTQALATYEAINSIGKVSIHDIDQDFQATGGKLYLYAVMGEIKTYPAVTNISMSILCLLN
jgi:hypothetical protein